MKTTKLFFALLALSLTASIYAGNSPDSSTNETKFEKVVTDRITHYFRVRLNNDYDLYAIVCNNACKKVKVYYSINENDKIVPLKVLSENEELSAYVMKALTERPITIKKHASNNIYGCKLRFELR